jgi:hypothetical protein
MYNNCVDADAQDAPVTHDVRRQDSMSDYPIGEDYEWLAIDSLGQIARFTTGGEGPIPEAVLAHPEVVHSARKALYQIPRTSNATILVRLPRPSDFEQIAELGIFGYDWQDVCRKAKARNGVYEPISIPSKPVLVGAAPELIQKATSLVRLPGTFGAGCNIDVRALMPCAVPA